MPTWICLSVFSACTKIGVGILAKISFGPNFWPEVSAQKISFRSSVAFGLAELEDGDSLADLITRAADVVLKERRKLICVVRETPYNLIHLKNMETLTLAGGIICPATPSFYSVPKTIEEVAATVVDRVIDLAGLKIDSFRWGGN